MSDEQVPTTQPASPSPPAATEDAGTAKVIYILYLVSIVVGITSIIGVIMAYVKKSDAPDWLASHYRFQIRTFWMGFLYSLVGMITMPVMIGFLVFLFVLVWLIGALRTKG